MPTLMQKTKKGVRNERCKSALVDDNTDNTPRPACRAISGASRKLSRRISYGKGNGVDISILCGGCRISCLPLLSTEAVDDLDSSCPSRHDPYCYMDACKC